MKDDVMQMIKERLLSELIDKMSVGDDRMKPKGLGVEVQAPDKEHLAEGLEKAKDILGESHAPETEPSSHEPEDDEERMLELLANEDDDEDERHKY